MFLLRINYSFMQGLLWKAFVLLGFPFSFIYNVAETLKIHSKSYKNHKMENEDVLESSWLDLCSGCIILYVLVEKSCSRFLPMLLREKFISAVVLLQLTWNFYGRLLMWFLMCSKNFSFIVPFKSMLVLCVVPIEELFS